MTPMKKILALACMASMLGMGVAVAQTDPAVPEGGDAAAAPATAAPAGDAMSSKKMMTKKHMSKKMSKKKGMSKSM